MNDDNLIPLDQRAKSVQREIQSMGGKAHAESARRKKTLKEAAEAILSLSIKDGDPADVSSAHAVSEIARANLSVAERIVLDLIATAISDTKDDKKPNNPSRQEKMQAVKLLISMIGQQTVDVTVRKSKDEITYEEAIEWVKREMGT